VISRRAVRGGPGAPAQGGADIGRPVEPRVNTPGPEEAFGHDPEPANREARAPDTPPARPSEMTAVNSPEKRRTRHCERQSHRLTSTALEALAHSAARDRPYACKAPAEAPPATAVAHQTPRRATPRRRPSPRPGPTPSSSRARLRRSLRPPPGPPSQAPACPSILVQRAPRGPVHAAGAVDGELRGPAPKRRPQAPWTLVRKRPQREQDSKPIYPASRPPHPRYELEQKRTHVAERRELDPPDDGGRGRRPPGGPCRPRRKSSSRARGRASLSSDRGDGPRRASGSPAARGE
jgi:hypothetical protein